MTGDSSYCSYLLHDV